MPYDAYATERLSSRYGSTARVDDSDARSAFARDRDRILYSSAFRRLAGKTQVVATHEFGLYHTRLTHSLKVAQLGRRLAERLRDSNTRLNGAPQSGLGAPDPDLVEAACLAHDLGHPPFGHCGEKTLQSVADEFAMSRVPLWQRRLRGRSIRNDVAGFEGNAQTFRILTYLSVRTPIDPRCGLDLTRAALDAATKYPALRATGWQGKKDKWGAIGLDVPVLEWVRDDEVVGPNARRSFEAQVMDWCDDVTYAVHDVVDFYRGGHIPLHRLLAFEGPSSRGVLSPEATAFLDHVHEHSSYCDWDRPTSDEAWLALARLSELTEPWRPTLEVKSLTQTVTSELITFLVDSVGWSGAEPCLHQGDFVIDPDPDNAALKERACDLLKAALWLFVIETPAVATQQRGEAKIVRDLVEIYANDPWRLLPDDRREDLREHRDELRAAIDHVASLTEQDAQALYQRLTGAQLGAVTDAL